MKHWVCSLAIYLLLLYSGGSYILAQPLLNSKSLLVSNQTSITIADVIALSSERPILLELTFQSGVLTPLSENNLYTFFAPTEEALQELQYENAQKLRAILLHHIVPGRYKLADLKDGIKLLTLAGDSLTIFRKKREVLVDSIPVVSRDNEIAKNGIIYTISDILHPNNLE
ncbi:fasciclin domain-containing protein [Adhaeribacter radiodurans]|uniref:Fasciclin domain-containing protein n=1 Tax=Adhaeribacter radiodurans TaxID=2745197 RepID=A0A7L7LE49_9BACT|nr:fasciclin domain-containing protein [Adhaeribacter radiodurans]QMU31091.1 fasciclin domain-containing protein [Adhaeribacter radiodurans]